MIQPPSPLAISLGEPAGIGPDVIFACWQASRGNLAESFFVVGCAATLGRRGDMIGATCPVIPITEMAADAFTQGVPVLDRPVPHEAAPGRPDTRNAEAVTGWIREAVQLCLAGQAGGMVTGPIQKETLYAAGFRHQGHTDFIAHLAREAGHEAEPVMMLSAGALRTVPLTVHIPLRDVPDAVTSDEIVRQGRVIARDLGRYFAISKPRIAVAGLNPHAGEGGTIGREDVEVIAPAIAALRIEGVDPRAPLADTMFHDEARRGYDLALCMYHDQALIPVKTIGFHDGINTTLGLPFVRTSPDHGTALSLAGTGRANPSSMMAALGQARAMAAALRRDSAR